MTFKQYWNSQDLDKYRTTEDYCAATWNACKQEVLKILQSSDNQFYDNQGFRYAAIKTSVIKEIEKL